MLNTTQVTWQVSDCEVKRTWFSTTHVDNAVFHFFPPCFRLGGENPFPSNYQNLEPAALQADALYSFQLFCSEQVYSRSFPEQLFIPSNALLASKSLGHFTQPKLPPHGGTGQCCPSLGASYFAVSSLWVRGALISAPPSAATIVLAQNTWFKHMVRHRCV